MLLHVTELEAMIIAGSQFLGKKWQLLAHTMTETMLENCIFKQLWASKQAKFPIEIHFQLASIILLISTLKCFLYNIA